MTPDKMTMLDEPANGSGFYEAGVDYDLPLSNSDLSDASRFAQSLALSRTFSLIETAADRDQVLALARRLAGSQEG